jgi:hypothetical protein
MPPDTFDYPAMLRVLLNHQVEFIVIGGVCAMLHGSSMGTVVVDIVPARHEENLKRLQAALTELHAYYREHPPGRILPNAERLNTTGHHLLMTSAGALDILGTVAGGIGYNDLIDSTVDVELEPNLRITMVTLPMLIQLKQETNRAKDRLALPILRQLLQRAQNDIP